MVTKKIYKTFMINLNRLKDLWQENKGFFKQKLTKD